MDSVLNIIIPCNTGELTSKKIEAIQNKLSSKYPTGIIANQQLIIRNDLSTISIAQNQIVCSSAKANIETVTDGLKDIFGLLFLDEHLKNLIIQINQLQEFNGDFMAFTKDKFTSLLSDIIGTGIRHIFKLNDNLCEFKIEPFLSNNNNIFVEAIYNFTNISINDVLKIIDLAYTDYTGKYDYAIKALLK
jgi:hypothetical protein